MHAPDTQSTREVPAPSASAGRFQRDSGFLGNVFVSQELRPAKNVVQSGKRRADP